MNLGDDQYTEADITYKEIYDFVDKTGVLPKTSARTPEDYKEVFSKLREKYDAVIHFSLSFEISSTGTNAVQAAKELENVYVIDTKQLSSGSGILILSAIVILFWFKTYTFGLVVSIFLIYNIIVFLVCVTNIIFQKKVE